MTRAHDASEVDAASMTGAAVANTSFAVSLQGTVHAVSRVDENRIDTARQMISPLDAEVAPVVSGAALEALLRGGARFANLRSPDRRPHPACARGLLARVDARVRATGLRACLVAPDGPPDAWRDALAFSDACVSREEPGFTAQLRLCEDIEDLRVARRMPAAVLASFTRGVRSALPALTALCDGDIALEADAEGALWLRVPALRVAPHVVLAAVLAAGVDAGAPPIEDTRHDRDAQSASVPGAMDEERAAPTTLAALLGRDVVALLRLADTAPPGGPSL
jgi:hypothetical protein